MGYLISVFILFSSVLGMIIVLVLVVLSSLVWMVFLCLL